MRREQQTNDAPIVVEQPRIERDDEGNLIGGYKHHPSSSAKYEDTVATVNGAEVPILGHWVGRGELESVQEALAALPGHLLTGLTVRFANEPIATDNASYTHPGALIKLSRRAARDWSTDVADEINRLRAKQTVWHEVGHHVWITLSRTGLQMRWQTAAANDSIDLRGLTLDQVREKFADDFMRHVTDPNDLPENLKALFEELLRGS